MKTVLVAAVVAMCLGGLAACDTTKNYSAMYVRGWTRESMDKRFQVGITEHEVVDRLGYPFRSGLVNGLERWDYAGGKTSQQIVSFIFLDGKLVQKQYENF